MSATTDLVLMDVFAERAHQEQLGRDKRAHGIDWRSCADPLMTGGDGTRYLVLGEEFGEVGRAVLEKGYGTEGASDVQLYDELIQVAAVAVAWAECVNRRSAVEIEEMGSTGANA